MLTGPSGSLHSPGGTHLASGDRAAVHSFPSPLSRFRCLPSIKHWVACGSALWCLLHVNDGWIDLSKIQCDDGSCIYAAPLQRSLTQFTPAATNIQARTNIERVHSLCVIMFASLTFSSLSISITSTMHQLHATQTARESQTPELRNFFVEKSHLCRAWQ